MVDQSEALRRLYEADDERYRAMQANDADALAPLFAEDLVYTHSSAVVDNKQQYLDAVREKRMRYLAAQRHDAVVRLYGPVAVMHGRVIMQVETPDGKKDLHNLFQAVWVERDERWLLASWASTVIPSA